MFSQNHLVTLYKSRFLLLGIFRQPFLTYMRQITHQDCQMVYFQTKNHDLGKFWKMLVYFTVGIFYGHLVYFMAIRLYFSRFGMLHQEKSGNHVPHYVINMSVQAGVWNSTDVAEKRGGGSFREPKPDVGGDSAKKPAPIPDPPAPHGIVVSVAVRVRPLEIQRKYFYLTPCGGRCYDHYFMLFADFRQKMAFFLKANVMIKFLHNCFEAIFFRHFFRENIFKIITSIADLLSEHQARRRRRRQRQQALLQRRAPDLAPRNLRKAGSSCGRQQD
jgi:hypothetical protein